METSLRIGLNNSLSLALVSFPVAVLKCPNKNNLRQSLFWLTVCFEGPVHCDGEVKAEGAGSILSYPIHSQEAGSNEHMLVFSSLTQSRTPWPENGPVHN